jgi:carboxylate-amine ligase
MVGGARNQANREGAVGNKAQSIFMPTRISERRPRRSRPERNRTRGADVDGAFTVGIEEEYFISSADTLKAPRRVGDAFFRRAAAVSRGRVKREFLQAQCEAVTSAHADMASARAELAELRDLVAAVAREHGLTILACGSHPTAAWRKSTQTEATRYDRVMEQLQMVGRRDMLCGLHVHVELPDPERRVDVMFRMTPYLPLFVALSTSSPFWNGLYTGFNGYRLVAYSEIPRTGPPLLLRTAAQYRAYVDAMTRSGAIPDASYLWWAMRPSLKLPTLELRAPDCCTRIDDAIAVAALYRVVARSLCRERRRHARLDGVQRALSLENLWRAQRYGVHATFVTGDGPLALSEMLEQVLAETAPDAEALGCETQVLRCRDILREGTSADRQLSLYRSLLPSRGHRDALAAVSRWINAATLRTDRPGAAARGGPAAQTHSNKRLAARPAAAPAPEAAVP